MPKNGNGVMTKIKVAQLEVKVDTLVEDVKEIKENHLVHINDKIESLEKRIAYWSGGAGVAILIVQLIIAYLKK